MTDEGVGPPNIVCIHGSWDDHRTWDTIAASLRERCRVVTYDRRGHSASTDVPGQGTILEDARDAATLLEQVAPGEPFHVIGHSYGACIAIVLATTRPDLVASLYLHEPPLFAMLAQSHPELFDRSKGEMSRAAELLATGELEKGTIHFIEEVAFGEGAWLDLFDEVDRATMLANADTWLDQSHDPERLAVDVSKLAETAVPLTMSVGTASLPSFRVVTEQVVQVLPHSVVEEVVGGAHGSPKSHPDDVIDGFLRHLRRVDP